MMREAKYESLKEEILFNANEVNIRNYNMMVLKSKQYITTEAVKQMKFFSFGSDWHKYFGIEGEVNQPMTAPPPI